MSVEEDSVLFSEFATSDWKLVAIFPEHHICHATVSTAGLENRVG